MDPIIIIGSGLAGYSFAREFRKLDLHTPLCIVTADNGAYYSKPQLSSAHTYGKTAAQLATATAEQMAEQLKITIVTQTRINRLAPDDKAIYSQQQKLNYHQLVLALGADPIQPIIAGNASDAVLSINSLEDYQRFRSQIKDKKRIALIGAGLIACEFANDLLNAGYHIDIIAPVATPLDRLLPPIAGHALARALAKQGLAWHLNSTVVEINHTEACYKLGLSDGTEIKADAILSAIGLHPHTALAKTGNLATNQGVKVNYYLQTSAPDIYALGDCAEVEGIVLLYIAPLATCARSLAKTLTGNPTPVHYPAMPIIVKTPLYPIVAIPPPKNISGSWQIELDNDNVRALFYDPKDRLRGFVLTGHFTQERAKFTQLLPDILNPNL